MQLGKRKFFLIIYFVFYLILCNFLTNPSLNWDESVHAAAGVFFADYFKTVLSGELISLPDFYNQYSQVYPIRWAALYHPPAHAILEGILFPFFGINELVSRLATQIFVIVGLYFFYLLLRKKFGYRTSLLTTILLSLSPIFFRWAREPLVDSSLAAMMIVWYYNFFHQKGIKKMFLGTIPLLAAFMLKYTSIIFLSAFIFAYFIIEWAVKKRIRSGMIFRFAIQFTLCLLIALPWLQFSLIDNDMIRHYHYYSQNQGIIENDPNWKEPAGWTYYVTGFFEQTSGLFLLGILGLFHKSKGKLSLRFNTFLERAALFIIIVYLVSTFIDNKDLRYTLPAVPFLFILFANFLEKLDKKFFNAVIVLSAGLILLSTLPLFVQRENVNVKEVVSFAEDPKMVYYLICTNKDWGCPDYGTHSPELLEWEFMKNKKQFNPFKFTHSYYYAYWDPNTEQNYFELWTRTASQIPTYIVINKEDSVVLSSFGGFLSRKGYKNETLTDFVVYNMTT